MIISQELDFHRVFFCFSADSFQNAAILAVQQHLGSQSVSILSPDLRSADVHVDLQLRGEASEQHSVHYRLYDPQGDPVASGRTYERWFDIHLDNIELWNAENPSLYTLELRYAGEYIVEFVGMREIHISDQVVYINGQKVKFRGVNRHDSDPVVGPAVDEDHMLRDLVLMKQHNVNAIRTSHYPNSPLFARMCDHYGFYLIGEADLECHGVVFKDGEYNEANYNLIAQDVEFCEAILDRVQHSVIRDKNRPCIVIWSMGNESGMGANLHEALRWTKEYDPSRLTHYERASFPPPGERQTSSVPRRTFVSPQCTRFSAMIICEMALAGLFR